MLGFLKTLFHRFYISFSISVVLIYIYDTKIPSNYVDRMRQHIRDKLHVLRPPTKLAIFAPVEKSQRVYLQPQGTTVHCD